MCPNFQFMAHPIQQNGVTLPSVKPITQEGDHPMKKKKKKSSAKRKSRTWTYPVEVRQRIVKIYLEEEYSTSLLSEQFSISRSAIRRWVRLYRQRGVEGLEVKPRAGGNTRVTPEVRQRMVAVKEAHPEYGPRRIADVLQRFFLIPTSQLTVHKTLSGRG